MHYSAMENGRVFFETYSSKWGKDSNPLIVDIGSQDINGSLREVAPKNFKYCGLDFQNAKGVDIVLEDPYSFPLEDNSADVVVSSSCFEHSEMFWEVYLEVMRILKPDGLLYVNAPSSGAYHTHPVDCWRFYPDSGHALINWGKRTGLNSALLESYIQTGSDRWCDFVGVFLKDEAYLDRFSKRILDSKTDFANGWTFGATEVTNHQKTWEGERTDKLKIVRYIKKLLRKART